MYIKGVQVLQGLLFVLWMSEHLISQLISSPLERDALSAIHSSWHWIAWGQNWPHILTLEMMCTSWKICYRQFTNSNFSVMSSWKCHHWQSTTRDLKVMTDLFSSGSLRNPKPNLKGITTGKMGWKKHAANVFLQLYALQHCNSTDRLLDFGTVYASKMWKDEQGRRLNIGWLFETSRGDWSVARAAITLQHSSAARRIHSFNVDDFATRRCILKHMHELGNLCCHHGEMLRPHN